MPDDMEKVLLSGGPLDGKHVQVDLGADQIDFPHSVDGLTELMEDEAPAPTDIDTYMRTDRRDDDGYPVFEYAERIVPS